MADTRRLKSEAESGDARSAGLVVPQRDPAVDAIWDVWYSCPNYGSKGCRCGPNGTPDRHCPVHWAVHRLEANGFDYHQTKALARGTPETAEPSTPESAPESAAGRMANRPGEPDAALAKAAIDELRSCWDSERHIYATQADEAVDRLEARLSEAERERDEAQQWCVDEAEKHDATKTRLARAERHLSDYEQALRDLLADLPVVRNAADWNRISSVRAARAALSGSTRPDDASV